MSTPSRTAAYRERARAMRLAGKTYREIGQQLGVTHQYVYQLIGSIPPPVSADDALRQQQMVEMRTQGKTCAEIAVVFGVSENSVQYHTREIVLTDEQRAAIAERQAYKIGAALRGITVEEYTAHREAGDRWCGAHRAWEPSERFVWIAGSLGYICEDGNRENVRRYQNAEYRRDYYQRNQERLNAYRRLWRNENPERYQAHQRTASERRRAQRQAVAV